MNYPSTPEFVADIEIIDDKGNSEQVGSKIIALNVSKAKDAIDGEVLLDCREFQEPENNLMIRIPLSVLVAALSRATLHADHNP